VKNFIKKNINYLKKMIIMEKQIRTWIIIKTPYPERVTCGEPDESEELKMKFYRLYPTGAKISLPFSMAMPLALAGIVELKEMIPLKTTNPGSPTLFHVSE
jgi:hypothetical protein